MEASNSCRGKYVAFVHVVVATVPHVVNLESFPCLYVCKCTAIRPLVISRCMVWAYVVRCAGSLGPCQFTLRFLGGGVIASSVLVV